MKKGNYPVAKKSERHLDWSTFHFAIRTQVSIPVNTTLSRGPALPIIPGSRRRDSRGDAGIILSAYEYSGTRRKPPNYLFSVTQRRELFISFNSNCSFWKLLLTQTTYWVDSSAKIIENSKLKIESTYKIIWYHFHLFLLFLKFLEHIYDNNFSALSNILLRFNTSSIYGRNI